MTRFPRILLITWWPHDACYASGEALRKMVSVLPAGSVWWCALRGGGASRPIPELAGQTIVEPHRVHWRLRGWTLGRLIEDMLQAPALARRIARATAIFGPEMIWVAAELGAVPVAAALRRRLRLPVHATVHDAYPCARFSVRPLYYAAYIQTVRALMRRVESMDAISEELYTHTMRCYGQGRTVPHVVFPASVGTAARLVPADDPAVLLADPTRRIALCGSVRQEPREWRAFVELLGQVALPIELVLFGQTAMLADGALPANVTVKREPYAATEAGLILRLRALRVHAGYVGLWHGEVRRLFAETSLSSKITPFAAAALPLIFDGPETSVAWRLVDRYRAGVRLVAPGECSARERGEVLRGLLTRADLWRKASEGSARLCEAVLSLETNGAAFRDLLRANAAGEKVVCAE